jgi:hypothetical protein
MTLACALSAGVSIRRAAALTDGLHIPLRTLQRWRRWWLADFVQTPFWRGKRALFMPPVEEPVLPESLRSRLQAEGDWGRGGACCASSRRLRARRRTPSATADKFTQKMRLAPSSTSR